MTYRDEAKASRSGKVARVLNGANKSNAESVMASEGARGTSPISRKADNQTMKAEGKKSKERFDRPARARGGIVARKAGGSVRPSAMDKFKEIEASADDSANFDFSPSDKRPSYRKDASGRMNYYEKGGSVKRARGGSVKKGKTNVTVIVAPQGGAGGAPGVSVSSGPPPMMPPAGAAPMGGPPPGAMPPPGAGAPPRPPMGPPPQGMPMRKRGGPVMKAGAGGGLGRLEKAGMK